MENLCYSPGCLETCYLAENNLELSLSLPLKCWGPLTGTLVLFLKTWLEVYLFDLDLVSNPDLVCLCTTVHAEVRTVYRSQCSPTLGVPRLRSSGLEQNPQDLSLAPFEKLQF